MKLLLVIIGLLPLFVTCCSIGTIGLDGDYGAKLTYTFDCTEADNMEEFAVCVTQRNSLSNLLDCAMTEKVGWRAPVARGSGLDNEQDASMTEGNLNNDGELYFTSKDLLLKVASVKRCNLPELAAIFKKCPENDWESFRNCLCCERVKDSDIEALRHCLTAYPTQFAVPAMLSQPANWLCDGNCAYVTDSKNKCLKDGAAVRGQGNQKVCRSRTKNGYTLPLKRKQARAYEYDETNEDEVYGDGSGGDGSYGDEPYGGESYGDDTYEDGMYEDDDIYYDEIDTSDYDDFDDNIVWTMTEMPTARTYSSIPPWTGEVSSAYATASGTPTNFATWGGNPPASPTAAAGGESKGAEGDSGAGQGCRGTNHVLLGSFLAFVGIVYQLA